MIVPARRSPASPAMRNWAAWGARCSHLCSTMDRNVVRLAFEDGRVDAPGWCEAT